jgi:SOS-response transcriptional repressor LexA
MAISAFAPSTRTTRSSSTRSTWSTTRRKWSRAGGIPADAQVIVAGQDLVTDGDMVNAGPADEAMIKKLIGEAAGTN